MKMIRNIFISCAVLILISSCASSAKKRGYVSDADVSKIRRDVASAVSEPKSKRRAVVDMTLQHLGMTYSYGKDGESGEIDCSALVKNVYSSVSVDLPRNSADQFRYLRPYRYMTNRLVMPGDLVFFRIKKNRISHVGIMVDEVNFIHASPGMGVVTKASLKDRYWRRHIAGFADPFGEVHTRVPKHIDGYRAQVWN